jgi:hypothetical protein
MFTLEIWHKRGNDFRFKIINYRTEIYQQLKNHMDGLEITNYIMHLQSHIRNLFRNVNQY